MTNYGLNALETLNGIGAVRSRESRLLLAASIIIDAVKSDRESMLRHHDEINRRLMAIAREIAIISTATE